MKKEIILAAVMVLLVVPVVFAYTPVPGSPLANNEHPRLHITPKTLPELRNIINTAYRAEYQAYINDVIAGDSGNPKYTGTGDTAHFIFRGMMLHEAFVGLLNLSGFNYGSTNPDQIARSAIARLQSAVSSGKGLNYVTTITYDWTYNAMTPQERESIALDMLDNPITQDSGGGESLNVPSSRPFAALTSSKYMESAHAPYVALPLYGNPNPSVHATASNALDKFSTIFINYGYFDGMNFVGGEGGVSEWLNYAFWHPISHFLLVDGWTTATGENYVSQKSGNVSGNLMKNFPKFLFYAFDPHKYYSRDYYFVHAGISSNYESKISPAGDNGRYLGFLPRSLVNAGAVNESGIMSYFLDKYVLEWSTGMDDVLPLLLGVPKNYTPISPESYGLSKSEWFKRMGVFYARTGFSSPADSVFSVVDSHFIYDGRGFDINSLFSLTKFGELVNMRSDGQHRGYGNLNDYTNGYSDNTINLKSYESTISQVMFYTDFENADKGQGNYERGGIEQVTRKDREFYHVRIDKSLRFNSGVSHTREYVWFPGANPADDSDFLVVYDRAATPSMQPRWVYHVSWKPSANIAPTSSFNDDRIGEIYTGSNIIIKELNSIGDAQDGPNGEDYYTTAAGMHGVAFAKTILPQLAQVEVSRVRALDPGDVINEQGDGTFKQTRWQVDILPQTAGTNHRFLNIFQTADANKVSSMTNTQLIETLDMQGTFIERENSARPNFVVLFTKNAGINNNAISYTINGNGETRHVISGLKPRAYYNIYDNGVLVESKLTEGDVELWDYKGVAVNVETGVLYFTTNLGSEHTITISEGELPYYTFIALPDTQEYSASSSMNIFANQTQWIADNKDNLNIVFVSHLGDIVNDDIILQWDRANLSMNILDGAGVGYSVLPGNHDYGNSGQNINYNKYFGIGRFGNKPWYGEGYDGSFPSSNNNNYNLFSLGGEEYILISLQYNPSSAEVAWADGILKRYPNRKAIISTHAFLNESGQRAYGDISFEHIWDNLVVLNENVFLVLNGHMINGGEANRTDYVNGRVVHQLLSNYQNRPNGGNGFLRRMKFVPSEDRIYVYTYSPWLSASQCLDSKVTKNGVWRSDGCYENDSNSEFVLNLAGGAPATCSDGRKNQDETGVDCGGVCVNEGKKCGNGIGCGVNSDCVSNNCVGGVCTALGNAPAAPSNLIATLVNRFVNLFWSDNSGNEDNFIVQRSADGVTWDNIATLPANTKTYEDSEIAFSPIEGIRDIFSNIFKKITGYFIRG